MLRSLYNSAAALNVLNRQHELIADNLANVNSGGHRRAFFTVAERSNNSNVIQNVGYGPELAKQVTDFSIGRQVQTGRNLDVGIATDGFFVLEDPNGNELYTRAGRFYRDAQTGELRGEQNLPILGDTGPISIPPSIAESAIVFGNDGTISAGGQTLGKLKLVAFEDNSTLTPVSQSVFRKSRQTRVSDANVQVQQKFNELSNVNATTELIGMIIVNRQYDAIQRSTRTISETMQENIRG